MAPKRGSSYPRKEAAPATVADLGSACGEVEHEDSRQRKIERLRSEIQKLHEEGDKGRSQSSSTAFLATLAAE